VIRNDVGLNFSETESIDCASNFFGFDSNGYEKLIAKSVDNQDFCGNGGHLHYLLPCFLRRWTGCVFRLGRAPQGKELRRTYFGRLLPFLNNPPRPDAIFFVIARTLIHDMRPVLVPCRHFLIVQPWDLFRKCTESRPSRKVEDD
jgi:hypothetical protein